MPSQIINSGKKAQATLVIWRKAKFSYDWFICQAPYTTYYLDTGKDTQTQVETCPSNLSLWRNRGVCTKPPTMEDNWKGGDSEQSQPQTRPTLWVLGSGRNRAEKSLVIRDTGSLENEMLLLPIIECSAYFNKINSYKVASHKWIRRLKNGIKLATGPCISSMVKLG